MASCLPNFSLSIQELLEKLCFPLEFLQENSDGPSYNNPQETRREYRDLRHLRSYAIDDSKTKVVDDAIALDSKDDNAYWVFIADATPFIKIDQIKSYCSDRKIDRALVDKHLSLGATEFNGFVLGYKFERGLKSPVEITIALIRPPIRYNHEEVAERIRNNSEEGEDLCNLLCFAEIRDERYCRHTSANDIRKLVQTFMSATCKFAGEFAHQNDIPFIFRSQKERYVAATFSSAPAHHACLETETYAQVTSPLRRWGDTINHFQLAAFLLRTELPYNREDLEEEVNLLKRKRNLQKVCQ